MEIKNNNEIPINPTIIAEIQKTGSTKAAEQWEPSDISDVR